MVGRAACIAHCHRGLESLGDRDDDLSTGVEKVGEVPVADGRMDQPFRVGDFVRVDDFVGTVEDIGLRSTRFRTLDRTVISIPNGNLSDQRLETFAARDRMRLAASIGLEYSTTHAQMQEVLDGFERVLREHPKIWPDALVVKFKEFGASSLDIEIMAWFQVPTWDDFRDCRQQVLLDFMRVVEDAGTAFAFPTRTVHLIDETRPKSPAAKRESPPHRRLHRRRVRHRPRPNTSTTAPILVPRPGPGAGTRPRRLRSATSRRPEAARALRRSSPGPDRPGSST